MNAKRRRVNRRRNERHNSLGIEQLEPRAMLTSATFVPIIGILNVFGTPGNDTISISRTTAGQILVDGAAVSSATVFNTSSITIFGGAGADTIKIDQSNGAFAPGLGSETIIREIEFDVQGQAGFDQLVIFGQNTRDSIDLGVNGINLNGDDDVDITVSDIESFIVDGQDGDDRISGEGNINVGAAFPFPLDLRGGRGVDVLTGGAANDILRGNADSDFLDGGPGNDTLIGGSGDDRLGSFDTFRASSSGNDTMDGGGGIDTFGFVGTAGKETVKADLDPVTGQVVVTIVPFGGSTFVHRFINTEALRIQTADGNDVINLAALSVADRLAAGVTSVFLSGNAGDNTITGSAGDDFIDSQGNDVVSGLAGNDIIQASGGGTLNGNGGNDEIRLQFGRNHIVNGGSGFDTLTISGDRALQFNPGFFIDADRNSTTGELVINRRRSKNETPILTARATAIEVLAVQDNLTSAIDVDFSLLSLADLQALGITSVVITGSNGNDVIKGSAGPDRIDGGLGDDTIFGNAGDDILSGDAGADFIDGGAGNDTIFGGSGNDELFGGAGNDTLFGQDGDDRLFGEDGNDTLDGGPITNNDFLDEGPGQGGVVVTGTSGNDVILVGQFFINGQSQMITSLNGKTSWRPYINGETIIVHAGAGNDVVILEANAWNNWQAIFYGGDGNDSLHGGLKNDQLYGEAGNDWLFGLGGDDILVGGDGNDWLYGHAGRDLLIGGRGQDWLFGGLDDDVVIGGSTAFDANESSLTKLSQTWSSPNSYENRAVALLNGNGSFLSGTGIRLKPNSTVFDDYELDRMFGESGRDLFFNSATDGVFDWLSNEWVIL